MASILLIQDDEVTVGEVVSELDWRGFEVSHAPIGPQGLALAQGAL